MRTRIATIVLASALCSTSSAAQAMRGPDFYGVNVQPLVKLQVASPGRWGTFFSRQSAEGLTLARADAAWAWAELSAPVDGAHTYSWDRPDNPDQSLDRVVGSLARSGLRMVGAITTAPSWAGAGGRQITPAHLDDMAAFAGAFAARYGSSGSFWDEHPELPRRPVQDYELWTEGNSINSWSGQSDPTEYVAGVRPVFAAVHGADPAGRVMASVGWEEAGAYVRELYAAGIKGAIDGIAFHPYGFRAVDIFGLVRQVRAALKTAGDGALPIDVTEVGFPAKTAAVEETRAGTLSLAGETLARSDCGVQSFLVYASVGSETDAEGIDEGYMGIYRLSDGSPTTTAAALAAAATRLRTSPAAGIALCGHGNTPTAALLPLELRVEHQARCVTGHVTYFGAPVWGATLILRASGNTIATGEADKAGTAHACWPASVSQEGLTVHAQVDKVATSQVRTLGTAATASCRYRLRARIVRVGRTSTTSRMSVVCPGSTPRAMRVSVYRQRKGAHRQQRITRVTASTGHPRTVHVPGRLRPGDRLVFRRARSSEVPELLAVVVATRKLGAR